MVAIVANLKRPMVEKLRNVQRLMIPQLQNVLQYIKQNDCKMCNVV